MPYSTCSFTGHRLIKSSHIPYISELLERSIEYAYSEGCRTFLAGGALGFDTLAASAVLRYRGEHPDVRLVLYLPCKGQDDSWSARQREQYREMLSLADEVKYISEHYTDGCMRERNRALAESCDILIAYVGYPRSGSAQTARMAERAGVRVYNLYPTLEEKIGQKIEASDG